MDSLKRRRLARAWSIREMAQRAGVAKETIAAAERGEIVRLSSMGRIASALGVEVLDVPEFVEIIDGGGRSRRRSTVDEERQRVGAGNGEG